MGLLRAALLTLSLAACATFPATKVVTGELTKVERREDLEPRCGIASRSWDPECIRNMRAYRGVITDSSGYKQDFYFFTNEGNIIPQEGWKAKWRLHRHEIYPLGRCPNFGCQYSGFVDYMLYDDTDVSPIVPAAIPDSTR